MLLKQILTGPQNTWLVSVFAGLSVLTAYLLTLPPDITWAYQGADGGDLTTAVATLGVPHPSGYPTYILVGWVFSQLPVGPMAWRLNLLSAVAVAIAAWFLFKIVRQITGLASAALVAAWTFAFAPLVWSQAIITEVYGLHLFFVCLLLWSALQIRLGRSKQPILLGLCFGLACGVHLTIVFLIPLLIGLGGKKIKDMWVSILGGFILGLLIFAYLPLRSGQGAITWGTPHTASGFFDLVSGQIYQGYLFDVPPQFVGSRLLGVGSYLTEVGILGILFFIVGTRWVWHNDKNTLYWSALSAGSYAIYAIGYRTADSYVYLMPIFVFIGIAVGLGIKVLITNISSILWYRIVIGVILGWSLLIGILRGQQITLYQDDTATRFLEQVLTEAPENAVLLTYEDKHTFTLWYGHHVLTQRTDIAIVDTGLVTFDWYRNDLRRHYPHLTDLPQLADIFNQQADYGYPLCAVLEKEFDISWSLECLIPSTE
ncbi:MAG: DUF2723 domain-containing protein [Chloroflexota bacterium]